MNQFSSSRITRRNFLKLLIATGAGALGAGILRTNYSRSELFKAPIPPSPNPIKNLIFYIQENHSFDSLFAGFPGANGMDAGQDCPDSLLKDPPHKHADAFQFMCGRKLYRECVERRDEWGGFYDHIEPPILERWTDETPSRYGYRVPCIVISPYARAGYVSHTLHSHVSLLGFAETIFSLEPLTVRDARASDMLDCFDFEKPPLPPIAFNHQDCEE